MNNNPIINCPSIGGGGINTSDSISVNTGGYNYLTRNIYTVNSIQIYSMDSNCFLVQNNGGENAGIGFSGATDNITLWTATDGNNFLSFQDEDLSNSRFGGINGSA
jgi:hypothetical protein